MIRFWLALTRFCLWLRYRIRLTGLEDVCRQGTRGILFLPNHPALIDPIILLSRLWNPFRPRALADKDQIDRFLIRYLVRKINVLPIEESLHGAYAPKEIKKALAGCVEALRNGDNLVLYPSGHIYRTRQEDLRGNSAVPRILEALPDVRIVLVRTRGLWGSSFGWAGGHKPSVAKALLHGLRTLLASFVFFGPRREVTINLVEPDDLPRQAERHTINRYLEAHYNDDAPPNTYVPYTPWESGGVRVLPEPARPCIEGDPSAVPETTRGLVYEFLRDLTGVKEFDDSKRLAHDLGMDSMAGMDLMAYLQSEFGAAPSDFESLRTVGDVCLAAVGQVVATQESTMTPPPARWFHHGVTPLRPELLTRMTIPEAFLVQARRQGDKTLLADQTSGVRTNRELVLGCLALRQSLAALPGERLGVMLPASLGATTLFLGCLFAGKTPAMINWTTGSRNMLSCLDSVGVEKIVTARALVQRLEGQGVDFEAVRERFVYVEEIRKNLTRRGKLAAWLRSRLSWRQLDDAAGRVPDIAVILFTSGSESQPKAVPLTHYNLLNNLYDVYHRYSMRATDSLLGILPPFHSFGLITSVILPLALGLRAAYWPNPTDGAAMGKMIDAYGTTILAGTPTFLHGIVRASTNEQLRTLRLVVSGAEKCTDRVYEALRKRCPDTIVLEGYGATECSPIISVNAEDDPRAGTIGTVLPSYDYILVDPDWEEGMGLLPAEPGKAGMLLVRGPSVFGGYLNAGAPSPFVRYEGRYWYRTGDMVREDEYGMLTFAGRRKRFVKIGGEMISLPAIEAVLNEHFLREDDKGPIQAVVATPNEESPEIVLFAIRPIEREEANQRIRAAGLSGLHNIRRVIAIDELPLLGTGKCDYRTLQRQLEEYTT